MHGTIVERLSEYLDGSLASEEAAEISDHLESCAPCRALADDLERIRRRARALGPIEPDRDLWPEIEARLGVPNGTPDRDVPAHSTGDESARFDRSPSESAVIPLRGPRRPAGVKRSGSRRGAIRMSPIQAAAAALVLVAGTALTTWTMAAKGGGPAATPSTSVPSAYTLQVGTQDLPASTRERLAEVARLAEALAAARDRLSPETREILERNLRRIDDAITESLQALEREPENSFVQQYLDQTLERRAGMLREARSLAMAD